MTDIRKIWTDNRLTVVGSTREVQSFGNSNWRRIIDARFVELIERSPRRFIWEFKSATPPVNQLRKLSCQRPSLVLLLDYEVQKERIKGLVQARAGELEHCKMHY